MPKYKLSYFNMIARAEAIRLAFLAKEEEFEDYRVDLDSGWEKMKPTVPQGLLPILEVDGKVIPQSHAIERYLAREFDLYGKDLEEKTAVDVVIDTIEDGFVCINKFYYEKNEDVLKRWESELIKDDLPRFIRIFEDMFASYGENGWIVGSKLTIADLVLYAYVDYLMAMKFPDKKVEDVLSAAPRILENRKLVRETGNIKKYLDKRPVTVC